MTLFSFFNPSFSAPFALISAKNSRFLSTSVSLPKNSNNFGRATGIYFSLRLVSLALFVPFVSDYSTASESVSFDLSFYTKGITSTDLSFFSYFPIFSISIITRSVILSASTAAWWRTYSFSSSCYSFVPSFSSFCIDKWICSTF